MAVHDLNPTLNRRRFLTSTALTVGTTVGASSLLGACQAGGSGASAGKTTLTVMYAANELTPEYIKEFEKSNPDIKIKFIEFDQTRLNSMLAAGNPPDFVRGSATGSSNINARGLAANLDSYIEKSSVIKKDDLLAVNNGWRWDGKRSGQGPFYGLTKDWSQDATIWYNKSLFEQAGVEPLSATEPITYDKLLDFGKKLTVREGGKVKTYGFSPVWVWSVATPINMMIAQQGINVYNSDLTEADYTSPAAIKAIEWYIAYAQAHIGYSPLDPDPNGWDGPTFLANRMAASQLGYWFAGNIVTAKDEIKQNSVMAPAPQMGSKRISPCYAGIGAWIPEGSKNKDAAWKLMEYFMGGKPAEDRAKSGWGIPALKSLLPKMPQEQPFQKQAYDLTQKELEYLEILPDSPYSGGNLNTIIDKYLQKAIKNEISASAAAQQITDEYNKVLKEGKAQIS